jgi:predicted nucleic-acid-binding Zn-ribbon protein
MQHSNWECPKCKHRDFETDQFAATGGGLTKIFDIQNKKFTTVSCMNCRYTEIYKGGKSGTLENILDLFTT